jgi:hypothetical protein
MEYLQVHFLTLTMKLNKVSEIKKIQLSIVVHACSPGIQEAMEVGGSRVPGHPGLLSKF